MTKQVNVFVDNKPGRLRKLTETLAAGGINLRAIFIQDRGDFGVVKMLVDDPGKAQLLLADQGLAVALKDVLAVVVEDSPGGLCRLAEVLEVEHLNMVDAYGFAIRSRNEAVCCIEVDDPEHASKALVGRGFRLLAEDELCEG